MSSSRLRLASGFFLLALAASIVFCISPVRGADSFDYTGQLCASAAEMFALSGALGAGDYLYKPKDATVTVRRVGDDLHVQNASLGIEVTVSLATESQLDDCHIHPKNHVLASVGAIRIVYIESFDRVMRYRAGHAPPPYGADLTQSRTAAYMVSYGPYVLVSLWTSGPPGTLGCGGGEYYRVNPRTNDVLPFDGCVEGHKRVLPGLRQLPPA